MSRTHLLMARLQYGSGLRLKECVRLRVQVLDFSKSPIYVRGGKGDKDRVTFLPKALHVELQAHLERVKDLHDMDQLQVT